MWLIYYNNRIQKFTSSGGFITKWGTYGTGNGQFNYPIGVAVDSTGNVYVADSGNDRIQKFTSNGIFLTKWGTYSEPTGVAVDSAGNVYIAEALKYRIQVFRPIGTGTPSTLYVTTTGDDVIGDGTQTKPWQTIQHAIDQAHDGDTIKVSAGTYEENLVIDGKRITLQGESRDTTIIQVYSGFAAITISNVIDGKISGFTIDLMIAPKYAGIYAENAVFEISNNIIELNGVGISLYNSSPRIFSNIIRNNDLLCIEIYDNSNPLIGGNLNNANDIYGNTAFAILNETTNTIQATHNYWGTVNETEIQSMLSGNVNYKPWTNAGHTEEITTNQPPNQPTNISPTGTGVTLTPTLQSSLFSDPDTGDIHFASQWQVTKTSGDYSILIFDSGIVTDNLTCPPEFNIPSGVLAESTTYYWHVKHQDNHGAWSEWSVETSFTTTVTTGTISGKVTDSSTGNVDKRCKNFIRRIYYHYGFGWKLYLNRINGNILGHGFGSWV